mgnify:CR=1 FL=1
MLLACQDELEPLVLSLLIRLSFNYYRLNLKLGRVKSILIITRC